MRDQLPSGIVTFLFTDVEGSTTLLHELGAEGYAEALAEHRRVIREACARHSGVEVDTQGDAFFFAFPSAPGALAAGAEMTEALCEGPIQVRIGIHTGTPLLTDEGYVGDDVHFGARVAASAHGGQVVLSHATAELVESQLIDLGEHRLKDIAQAVPIFQLGQGSFPPLKTISNTNLPRPASSFVGREQELAEVLARIGAGARLLTLTGPGGSGKTRLALEAAASLVPECKAGVFWVGLASLRDPALVSETISQTLGAKSGLAEHIADREMLLLLDNLEQVIEVAAELASLLATCPNLTLLVTSRELLRVQGEVEYEVPPLAKPEAVALFCERAQVEPSEEIAELCARLDNLPLAVELAAARVKALSPAQILERISQRLDLLKGGRDADPRQQTLRATIEWSYDLLSDLEQQLFARLSVFSGGCTLEAAEEVCDGDLNTLQSLVEKSLLRFSDERYRMLETIRDFAGAQLDEAGETEALRRRHTAFFLALGERAEPELRGAEQLGWCTRLERDHDNLRAALSALQEAMDGERGLALATALWRFWRMHDHLAEGSRTLQAFLQLSRAAPASLRTRAFVGASRLAMDQGDVERRAALAGDALLTARMSRAPREIAAATENLALMMIETDIAQARVLLEESIEQFRAVGDAQGTADALNNLANVLLETGEVSKAGEAAERALALQRGAQNTFGAAFALHTLGYVALRQSDFETAGARLKECLALSQEFDSIAGIGDTLDGLGHVAAGRGHDRDAVVLWAAGEATRNEIGKRIESSEASLRSDALARARERLGEDAVATAWAEGAALLPEEAIAFALASLD